MTVENAIRALAGTLVLVGTILAWKVHPGWLILPGFVGANLLQSAFTHFCPAEIILKKLGCCSAKTSCCSSKTDCG